MKDLDLPLEENQSPEDRYQIELYANIGIYKINRCKISVAFFVQEQVSSLAEFLFLRAVFVKNFFNDKNSMVGFLSSAQVLVSEGIKRYHNHNYFILQMKLQIFQAKLLIEDSEPKKAIELLWKALGMNQLLYGIFYGKKRTKNRADHARIFKNAKFSCLISLLMIQCYIDCDEIIKAFETIGYINFIKSSYFDDSINFSMVISRTTIRFKSKFDLVFKEYTDSMKLFSYVVDKYFDIENYKTFNAIQLEDHRLQNQYAPLIPEKSEGEIIRKTFFMSRGYKKSKRVGRKSKINLS